MMIRKIVEEIFATGYLTISAENRLRELLQVQYDTEDMHAFMSLQDAVMSGNIRQESWELHKKSLTIAS